MRRKAIETLRKSVSEIESPLGQRVKRLHALISLLKERMEKEGINTQTEISEVEEIRNRILEKAANDPTIGDEGDKLHA